MKKSFLAVALAATLLTAGQAGAVTFVLGSTNSGPQLPTGYQSYKLYADFNDGNTMGLSGGSLKTGTFDDIYAAPAGDTTQYYAVGPDEGSPAMVSVADFNKVSLYWGSIDYYNTISFLSGNTVLASFNGSQLIGGSPNGAESHTVTFNLTPTERAQVTRISFSSTVDAFEFDNLAIGVGSVPEPATWATLMVGFGAIGGALRRRSRTKVVRFA